MERRILWIAVALLMSVWISDAQLSPREFCEKCSSEATCDFARFVNGKLAFECKCKLGFTGNGTYCEDIDECSAAIDPCGVGGTCKNTDGSYECQCEPGYQPFGPQNCGDIDECRIGSAACHADATCKNTIGSYTCTCNRGFTGDGITICKVGQLSPREYCKRCSSEATCDFAGFVNGKLAFECKCKSGFSGNGAHCEDIDECKEPRAVCNDDGHEGCSNTEGGFMCTCQNGYKIKLNNPLVCEDVDECDDPSVCLNATICENTKGSYKCICPAGYQYNNTAQRCEEMTTTAAITTP